MCNDSRRLSFENQNLMKTEKGQHEKLIIGIPISHRRHFSKTFMLSKAALLLEKVYQDRKQDCCETCSLKLKTAEPHSWFCCKLEILDIFSESSG